MRFTGPRAFAPRLGVGRAVLFLVAFAAAAGAEWAPPPLMSYQGVLHLQDGSGAASGPKEMEFRFYVEETAATAVWGEKHPRVQTFGGNFNVILGSGEPIDADGDGEPDVPHGAITDVFRAPNVWLGVTVLPDQEIIPRDQIRSTPYALSVQNAFYATHGVKAGVIAVFAGETAPYGWLPCDGRTVSATANPEYKSLWQAIGTTWGGTGEDNFGLPNFGGRTLIGAGQGVPNNIGTAAPLTPRSLAALLGEEQHKLLLTEMPPHTHPYTDIYMNDSSVQAINSRNDSANESLVAVSPAPTTGETGNDASHNTMQPSAVIKYMIKY